MCFYEKKTNKSIINIGTSKDYSITYYTKLISKLILKKKIKILFDKTKPNGVLKK